MKAQFIFEDQHFQRGQDPKSAMDVGIGRHELRIFFDLGMTASNSEDMKASNIVSIGRTYSRGESFGKLAEQYSMIQGAKASAGQLGWVYPSQVPLEISQIIVKMNKRSIYPSPVKTQNGWAILRVDDKRSFKLPGFEEAKPQLRQALIQQYLIEMIKEYRARAQITQ